jgi:hypothetical protein
LWLLDFSLKNLYYFGLWILSLMFLNYSFFVFPDFVNCKTVPMAFGPNGISITHKDGLGGQAGGLSFLGCVSKLPSKLKKDKKQKSKTVLCA